LQVSADWPVPRFQTVDARFFEASLPGRNRLLRFAKGAGYLCPRQPVGQRQDQFCAKYIARRQRARLRPLRKFFTLPGKSWII